MDSVDFLQDVDDRLLDLGSLAARVGCLGLSYHAGLHVHPSSLSEWSAAGGLGGGGRHLVELVKHTSIDRKRITHLNSLAGSIMTPPSAPSSQSSFSQPISEKSGGSEFDSGSRPII